MKDISDHINEEAMPLCPLCDNEIMDFEPALPVRAHGAKAVAHEDCVEELNND